MIPRYNRNISERDDAKEAKLVEIRARASVGTALRKGCGQKWRTSCNA